MDEINDFFSGKLERKTIVIDSIDIERHIPKPETQRMVKRERIGTEYVQEFKDNAMHEVMKFNDEELSTSKHHSDESDIESLQSKNPLDDVYTRYIFDRELPKLPIVDIQDEILTAIKGNPVIVLEGPTGCGKSTQVPQFILDDGYRTGKSVKIIVTQPRRIAAITLARRVSEERGLKNVELPHIIGYQIGLNVKTCDDTRITYMTTGVLLEKLINEKTMSSYTHIILDEVHERSQDMDFLFVVIRKLLTSISPKTKIILMSATIQAADFASYFQLPKKGILTPAPIIKIERENNYTVSDFYFNELNALNTEPVQFRIDDPRIDEDMYHTAVKLLYIADRIDRGDEISTVYKPTILIFLPGIYEIDRMAKHIHENSRMADSDIFVVIALHSMLTAEEQAAAFKRPEQGKRMIILATNIAESSITVPDVKYVIDFCLTKVLVTDTTTNFTSLQLEWCSRSNCTQRAGRTGRTMSGRVYRLVPKHFYKEEMDEYSKPEMLRNPLEKVVLKAKELGMGRPDSILAIAMDAPNLSDIANTLLLLKESGGMLRTCDGVFSDFDGDLTSIGRVMSALPVDIHIAKFIVLGHCFSVLSECIIIAAGLTTKSIFTQSLQNSLACYTKKLAWSDASGSDLFAILNAYEGYVNQRRNHRDAKSWTIRYYLNEKSLIEMSNLICEITQRLERMNIKEHTGVNRARWNNAEKNIILKVCIAGAFYPNYFVRSSNESLDRQAFREINGRDPCNTVYYTGFEEKYIRQLYVRSIKDALKPCAKSDVMQVNFDEGNSKAFISFKRNLLDDDHEHDFVESVPGQVSIEVYKALKLGRTSKPLQLKVMHPRDAISYAKENNIGHLVDGRWKSQNMSTQNVAMMCLPRLHVKEVYGQITHYETDSNRFWFRPNSEDRLFTDIQSELNNLNRDIVPFNDYSDIIIGQVLAAPLNGYYCRAKVLAAFQSNEKAIYKVIFMDIGCESCVEFSLLRRLCGVSATYSDLPPRIFECRLSNLGVSELHVSRYSWKEAMNEFKKLTRDRIVCAEIYSVVTSVASVFIKIGENCINEILIEKGLARETDESFQSKFSHDMRLRVQKNRNPVYENECAYIVDEMLKMIGFEEEVEVKEPEKFRRNIEITLSGPRNPLEATLYSAWNYGLAKRVLIEPHSVNSILLETNQDPFEKFVVSANVTQNQSGNCLTARETTIMPNIPGFGALMALIFAPYCEFFTDKYKMNYTSVLCGLGRHPYTKIPMFGEHDLLLNLDAEIDLDDIANINKIRFSMDSLLQMSPDGGRPKLNEYHQNQTTIRLKESIIQLLEKNRPLIGVRYQSNVCWSDGNSPDMIKAKDIYGPDAIFPFHNIFPLSSKDSPELVDHLNELSEHNKELHRMALMQSSLIRPIECRLCVIDIQNVSELIIHLHSRLHMEREKRIFY